jgi:C4-dicarboxylate transporter DctM subunit
MYGGLGSFGYLTTWNALFIQASTVPYNSVAVYFLIVIPLFLLMGSFCVFSGISKDLYSTAHTWLGRLPGALAMATIAGGAMFGAVCGDSIATAAAMGRVSLGPMKKAGYEQGFSGACVAVSGTLGILIPPSIPMVVYAILTDTSIADLFVAGIIPGILTALVVMGTIYLLVKRKPTIAPLGESTTFKQKIISIRGTGGMLLLFILVIGGMYAGWFTPIEAGAIGTVGALVFAMARRSVTWKNVNDSLLDAALMSGMVLLILIGITFMNSAMSLSRIPFVIADFAGSLEVSRWVIFAGLMVLYIIAGMIMNIFAAIMITIPILLPLLIGMHFDLVWLGIIMVLLVMIGQVTPPVAIVVYAVSGVAPDIPMGDIFKRVTILWLSEAFVIILVAALPAVALFLPNLMR